jgi:CBS domain containing-hemolysin-like protein
MPSPSPWRSPTITALHIVFGELAPKTVALQHPERTSLLVVRPTHLFMRVFWPFIWLLNRMGRATVRAAGLRPPSGHSLVHSEEELKMLVTASQEAGCHRGGRGADAPPRVRVRRPGGRPGDGASHGDGGLAADASLEQWCRRFPSRASNATPSTAAISTTSSASCGSPTCCRCSPAARRSISPALARDAMIVPETMRADILLGEMRARQTPIAIVIDEYGGTAGLVTFAGLMERIVGELGGGSGPRITVLADGSALVDGLALVTDINVQFGLRIDEDAYNTLGGYVLGRLGRRARLGDRMEVDGRTLRVEALDGLRVARVFISKPRESPPVSLKPASRRPSPEAR